MQSVTLLEHNKIRKTLPCVKAPRDESYDDGVEVKLHSFLTLAPVKDEWFMRGR
jgi:hypothetical protein